MWGGGRQGGKDGGIETGAKSEVKTDGAEREGGEARTEGQG